MRVAAAEAEQTQADAELTQATKALEKILGCTEGPKCFFEFGHFFSKKKSLFFAKKRAFFLLKKHGFQYFGQKKLFVFHM